MWLFLWMSSLNEGGYQPDDRQSGDSSFTGMSKTRNDLIFLFPTTFSVPPVMLCCSQQQQCEKSE